MNNSFYIIMCLIIIFFSCWIFTQYSNKIIESMYPKRDLDLYIDVLQLYRKHGVNVIINNMIKKYHENEKVDSDQKLMDFFIDSISIKNLDNCSTIKGYPALFMTVLQPLHFLPYNELIEKYPKMISNKTDYLNIKILYVSAQNMYHEDTMKLTCNQLLKTNCSAQVAPMVRQIHTLIDYFVNKNI